MSIGRWFLTVGRFGVMVSSTWDLGYWVGGFDGPVHCFSVGPVHFSAIPRSQSRGGSR